ncbi:MAG: LysM peptidoglycan-binding domain-containing protein [Myxococcales bacterium]|nr:LysM peptidoglycan-binding domain-containing protein [Myxococcales bacterium]
MGKAKSEKAHRPSGVHESPYGAVGTLDESRTLAEFGKTRRPWLAPLLLFVIGLVGFSLFAWNRLASQSTDPHFAYLAEAFLAGEMEIQREPPHGNDWATVTEFELQSGQTVAGVWYNESENKFVTLAGEMLLLDAQERRGARRTQHTFVSFPPGPSFLMMPFVAAFDGPVTHVVQEGENLTSIAEQYANVSVQDLRSWNEGLTSRVRPGDELTVRTLDFNDVWFTIFFGTLNLPLLYLLLRRISKGGRTGRSASDNIWLVMMMGFGSVYLFCTVLGQVWFTALIVGITFTLLYLIASVDGKHPILAGVFLALAFSTRTTLLFTAFVYPAFVLFPGGKLRRDGWGKAIGKVLLFGIGPLLMGSLLLYFNHLRFEKFSEFGHRYLAYGQLTRIRDYGLFNYHFLAKNLSAMFTLMPRIQPDEPYVLFSKHGMSIFLTTPAWIYLFKARKREYREDAFWYRLCWAAVLIVAIPHLLYQNTGYEQFGYRFSLDYTPYLVLLLALGRTPFTRWFKFWVVVGFIVNAFGAVTFKRGELYDKLYNEWFFDPD